MAKFKSTQEIVDHANKGGKFKSLSSSSGVVKGGEIQVVKGGACLNGSGQAYVQTLNGNGYNWTIGMVESAGPETKEDIKNEITSLDKRVEELRSKLKWLETTGLEDFDETQFKVWNTLQLLKTKKNDIEKAKLIAELINK